MTRLVDGSHRGLLLGGSSKLSLFPSIIQADAPITTTALVNARASSSIGLTFATFGHAFAPGDVPSGTRVKMLSSGTPVPLQQDAESYWPDGSLKFATLSAKPSDSFGPYSSGVGSESVPYVFVAETGSPSRSPAFSQAAYMAANDHKVVLTGLDAGSTTLVCSVNDILTNFGPAPWEAGVRTQTAASTSGATTITIDDTSRVTNGQLVTGTGIPANTIVSSKSGNVVTLSAATTANRASGAKVTINTPLGGYEITRSGALCTEWTAWSYLKVAGGPDSGKYHSQIYCYLYVRSWSATGPHEIYARLGCGNIFGPVPGGKFGPTGANNQRLVVSTATLQNGSTVLRNFAGPNDERAFTLAPSAFDTGSGTVTLPDLDWLHLTYSLGSPGFYMTSTGSLPGDYNSNTPLWFTHIGFYPPWANHAHIAGSRAYANVGLDLAYNSSTTYPPRSVVFSNNAWYQTVSGGTAAGNAPSGATPSIDGSVTWTRVAGTTWATSYAYAAGAIVYVNGGFYWTQNGGTSASSGAGPSGATPSTDGNIAWVRISGGSMTSQGSGTIKICPTFAIWPASNTVMADAKGEPVWDSGSSGVTTRPHFMPVYDRTYLTKRSRAVLPFDTTISTVNRTSGLKVDRGIYYKGETFYPNQVQFYGWKISAYGDDPGDDRIGYISNSSAMLINQQPDLYGDVLCRSIALGFGEYFVHARNERSGYPFVAGAGPDNDPNGRQYTGLGPLNTFLGYNTQSYMPTFQFYNGTPGIYPDWNGQENSYGPLADDTHMPMLHYIPYLRTGHRIYLDMMQTQAGHLRMVANVGSVRTFGSKSFYNSASDVDSTLLRGMAWKVKALATSRYFTPDADVQAPYYRDQMKDSADFVVTKFPAYNPWPQWNALGLTCISTGYYTINGTTDGADAGQNAYQYVFVGLVFAMEAWRDQGFNQETGWLGFLTGYANRFLINVFDVDAGGGFYQGVTGTAGYLGSGNIYYTPNADKIPTHAFQTPAALWADTLNGGYSVPQPAGFADPNVATSYPFATTSYMTTWGGMLAMWSWIGVPKAKTMWTRWDAAVRSYQSTGIKWGAPGNSSYYDVNTVQYYLPWAIAPSP